MTEREEERSKVQESLEDKMEAEIKKELHRTVEFCAKFLIVSVPITEKDKEIVLIFLPRNAEDKGLCIDLNYLITSITEFINVNAVEQEKSKKTGCNKYVS